MENASKALLIVAVVLLSIIIISMGILIYNKSRVTNGKECLSALELLVWNQRYLTYEGIQNGANVKVILSQASKDNEDYYKEENTIRDCVCIYSNSKKILENVSGCASFTAGLTGTRGYGVRYPSNIKKMSSWISNKDKYFISFGYNKNTGQINEVYINEVN